MAHHHRTGRKSKVTPYQIHCTARENVLSFLGLSADDGFVFFDASSGSPLLSTAAVAKGALALAAALGESLPVRKTLLHLLRPSSALLKVGDMCPAKKELDYYRGCLRHSVCDKSWGLLWIAAVAQSGSPCEPLWPSRFRLWIDDCTRFAP